jgi:hypothetical protein
MPALLKYLLNAILVTIAIYMVQTNAFSSLSLPTLPRFTNPITLPGMPSSVKDNKNIILFGVVAFFTFLSFEYIYNRWLKFPEAGPADLDMYTKQKQYLPDGHSIEHTALGTFGEILKGNSVAESCLGNDCTIEEQLCMQGSPGAETADYICKNKKWVQRGEKGWSTKN